MPTFSRAAAPLTLAAFLLLGAAGCGERSPRYSQAEFTGTTMGTTYHIKVVTEQALDATQREALHAAAFGALDAIDRKMSTYKPDSELSRFNRYAGTAPFPVSREMIEVFQKTREVSEFSGGAFDITVGPLVNAWGFGPAQRNGVPSAAEIAALRQRVGYRLLTVDPQRLTIAKARADVYCDLSAIASGYGVDQAAQALEARGINDYMVESGGELRTHGRNAEGRPWQIAIVRPDALPQQAYFIVPLSNLSLATSGDYRNYFERNGKRYSHHIDPTTGYPVLHNLASVSVVAAKGIDADVYAAALSILGPDKGYRLAEEKGLAAFFILREDDGRFTIRQTPAFAALNGHLADRP